VHGHGRTDLCQPRCPPLNSGGGNATLRGSQTATAHLVARWPSAVACDAIASARRFHRVLGNPDGLTGLASLAHPLHLLVTDLLL